MNILKSVLAFIGMLWGGMSGGQGKQGGKAPRRFIAPAIATGFAFSFRFRWKYLMFLLWIPIFSLGYGVDSHLGSWLGHTEWLIRAVYASLVAVPFAVFGLWRAIAAWLALVTAFAVRAGSMGFIGGFGDILIEDICRYGVWALCVILNVLFDKD